MAQALITFDPADLINVHFTQDIEKLVRLLNRITNGLYSASRQVNLQGEDLRNVRKDLQETNDTILRNNNDITTTMTSLGTELTGLWDNFKSLSASTVMRETYEVQMRTLEEKVTILTEKVAGLEASGGSRAEGYVRKYVADFVEHREKKLVETERDFLAKQLYDQRASIMGTLREETSEACKAVLFDAKKNDAEMLSEHKMEIENRKRDIASVMQKIDVARQELIENIAVAKQFSVDELANAKTELMDTLDTTSYRITTMYKFLSLDEKKVREALKIASSLDEVQYERDPRVQMIMNTPPFIVFRKQVSSEIQDRAEFNSQSVRDDIGKEFAIVHKELRAKATVSKVEEMVSGIKERSLDNEVKDLQAKITLLNTTKVNIETFADAMKTKVDQRSLDDKVERGYLTTVFDSLSHRIDETNSAIGALKVKISVLGTMSSSDPNMSSVVPQQRTVQKQVTPAMADAVAFAKDPRPPLMPTAPPSRETFEWASAQGNSEAKIRPHSSKGPGGAGGSVAGSRKGSAGVSNASMSSAPPFLPIVGLGSETNFNSMMIASNTDNNNSAVIVTAPQPPPPRFLSATAAGKAALLNNPSVDPSPPLNNSPDLPLTANQALYMKALTSSVQDAQESKKSKEERKAINASPTVVPYVPRKK
eukprot:PhF_6_TR25331/c0_g1_i1/m.35012